MAWLESGRRCDPDRFVHRKLHLELQWFITEQMEEEKLVGTVVEQIRMAGENQAALLMLDRELGNRTTGG